MIDPTQALTVISERLSAKRVRHCQAVAEIAFELAEHYQVSPEKAYLTGLLHDLAKSTPGKELLRFAIDHKLIHAKADYVLPSLLHAPVGAWLVQHELGVDDPEIIQAISCHTLGAPEMTVLDKIIYLADMIDPGRGYAGRGKLEYLAYKDLDRAMLLGLDTTMDYCISKARFIHPQSLRARNSFLHIVKSAEKKD